MGEPAFPFRYVTSQLLQPVFTAVDGTHQHVLKAHFSVKLGNETREALKNGPAVLSLQKEIKRVSRLGTTLWQGTGSTPTRCHHDAVAAMRPFSHSAASGARPWKRDSPAPIFIEPHSYTPKGT